MTRVWLQRLAGVIACWVALWLVLVGLDDHPQPMVLAGVVAGVAAVAWLLADVGPRTRPTSWIDEDLSDYRASGDDGRFTRLAEELSSAQDREAVAREVHRRLVAIVDDRLDATYGVRRRDDPAAAREILGPELDDYVTGRPSYLRTYADDLSELLSRIEAL